MKVGRPMSQIKVSISLTVKQQQQLFNSVQMYSSDADLRVM